MKFLFAISMLLLSIYAKLHEYTVEALRKKHQISTYDLMDRTEPRKDAIQIVCLGDSNTAGMGEEKNGLNWPTLVNQMFNDKVELINIGRSSASV